MVTQEHRHARCKRKQLARQQSWSSAGDDQIHRLRAFALLVGLDFELNPLSFVERFQSGLLDRGDVHEHIASAIVRLDEAVATLAIEELDRTTVCHRQTPSPANASPPTPTDGGSAKHSHRKKASALEASVTPPTPQMEAERLSQHA